MENQSNVYAVGKKTLHLTQYLRIQFIFYHYGQFGSVHMMMIWGEKGCHGGVCKDQNTPVFYR